MNSVVACRRMLFLLRLTDNLLELSYPGSGGTDGDKIASGGLRHDIGQSRLTDPGRPIKNDGTKKVLL